MAIPPKDLLWDLWPIDTPQGIDFKLKLIKSKGFDSCELLMIILF